MVQLLSTRNVRVLYVSHGATIGGAETNLLNIIRNARLGNFQPAGVLLPGDGPLVDAIAAVNCNVGFVRYHRLSLLNPLRYMQTLWQLIGWIRRTETDLVHLNHQWLVAHVARAARLAGIPCICHTRNYLDAGFASENSKALEQCDAILAESIITEHRAQDLGIPKTKLRLVHNGVDLSLFAGGLDRPSAKERFGLSATQPAIGFLGRVVPEKGPEDLLNAYILVLDRIPTAQLIFAGSDNEDGRFIAHLSELSSHLSISDRVKFIGFQSEIAPVLAAVDVLVVPSRPTMPEGMPLVILEGMTAGCIVVATPNSGAVEVVQHGRTGFLVEAENSKALAATIVHALSLSPTVRQEIVSNAQSRIAREFSIEQQVGALSQIYRSLVK